MLFVLDAKHVDTESCQVDGLLNRKFGSFHVKDHEVDMTDSDRCHDLVEGETLNVCLGHGFVVKFHVHVNSRHSESPAVQLEPCKDRTRAVTETSSQHQCVSVLAQNIPVILRMRLDQNSRPVSLQLEEKRVRQILAAVCAALDEKSVPPLFEKVVNKQGSAILGEIDRGWLGGKMSTSGTLA